MSEWKEIIFENLFSEPLKNGLNKPSRIRGSGIPMVNMKEIFGYDKISDDTPMELVPVLEKELNSVLKCNDLLFARQSLVEAGAGKVSIYLGNKDTVFESHLIRCRIDNKQAEPLFIYYLFKSPIGRLTMSTIVTQTAAAGIKGSDLKGLSFIIPPLPEQQAIAEVLSSLDDKIDLLHRNNKTLEEMAETLFRHWFVEGVKENWVTYRLDDISEHIKKTINPQKTEVTHFNHYSLPAFDNGKKPEYVDALSVLSNKYLVQTNDILISKLNPRTPRVWMIGKNQEESVCSTEFQVYRAKENEYKNIIYCFLKTQYVCDVLSGAASGTSGSHQRVNPEDISSLEIALPLNEAIIQKFHSITESIFIKVENNLKNISVLEKTRDTLLPKLMSGQVRVIS
jgi:type I restriction enzyme S subunit